MIYSDTFIKQSSRGVIAHVYEHIVTNKICAHLHANGLIRLVDFLVDAHTFDGIIVITIEVNSREVIDRAESILRSSVILPDEIWHAAQQVSCEYTRLLSIDRTQVIDEVSTIHAEPWTTRKEFVISDEITDSARTLSSPSLSFGRLSPLSFQTIEVTYTIPNCPFELKPLAVYLLQVIGLNLVDFMYNSLHVCYDAGDVWAKYQDLVGYAITFRLPKKQSIDELKLHDVELEFRNQLFTEDFTKRFIQLVKREAVAEFSYFSHTSMYANSYAIIGQKGWMDSATEQHITTLVRKLDISLFTE